jgi:hypothetical protein
MANAPASLQKGIETTQPVAANAHIYCGDLVGWTLPDKYLIPASDTAGVYIIGTALEECDNTGGSDGALSCRVYEGGYRDMTTSGLTRTDKRNTVYCLDAQTATTKAGTTNKIGIGVLIAIDETNNIGTIKL